MEFQDVENLTNFLVGKVAFNCIYASDVLIKSMLEEKQAKQEWQRD